MRLPATTEQNAAASAGAEPAPRAQHLLRDRSRNGNPDPRLRRNRTRQERNMIMEPLMAAAARRPTCSGWAAAPCTG